MFTDLAGLFQGPLSDLSSRWFPGPGCFPEFSNLEIQIILKLDFSTVWFRMGDLLRFKRIGN